MRINSTILKIIIPIIVAIIGAVAVIYSSHVSSKSNDKLKESEYSQLPVFFLKQPILRSNTPIIVIAENQAAKRAEPLNIKWDGITFRKAAFPVKNSNEYSWEVKMSPNKLSADLIKDGRHELEFAFKGEPFSKPIIFAISNKPPIVEAVIEDTDDSSGRYFKGIAATELQYTDEIIKVDIFFNHEGKKIEVNLPVKQIEDSEGRVAFQFGTPIHKLPQLSNSDPRYKEPFFAFKVTDQAGNTYFHEMSYAQFIAPGSQHFGVNRLASIQLRKLHDDISIETVKLNFTVAINPKKAKTLINGKPAIILKVTAHAENFNQLDWKSKLNELSTENLLTVVYRNEESIAIVWGDNYQDKKFPLNKELNYQVQQTGEDGTLYGSNIESGPPFLQAKKTISTINDEKPEDNENITDINYSTHHFVGTTIAIDASRSYDLNKNKRALTFEWEIERIDPFGNHGKPEIIIDRKDKLLEFKVNQSGEYRIYVLRKNGKEKISKKLGLIVFEKSSWFESYPYRLSSSYIRFSRLSNDSLEKILFFEFGNFPIDKYRKRSEFGNIVATYQRKNRLRVDGLIGPETLTSMASKVVKNEKYFGDDSTLRYWALEMLSHKFIKGKWGKY